MFKHLIFLLMLLIPAASIAQDTQVPLTNLEAVTQVHSPGSPSLSGFFQRLREGRVWTWAKRRDYHSAAVVVRVGSGAGSGTVIKIDDPRGGMLVITCAHVVDNNINVIIDAGGARMNGRLVLSWEQFDIAAVYVERPAVRIEGIPIGRAKPGPTAQIEVMGYGGPRFGTFRPYIAGYFTGHNLAPIAIDAPSISGDSGAGMVYNGELIGVQFGAYNAVNPPPVVNGVSLIYPASSKATPEILTQFGGAVCDRLGGGCRIYYGQPGPSQPPVYAPPVAQAPPAQFYPGQLEPESPGEVAPPAEVVPPANPGSCEGCVPCKPDYDKIAEEVWKRADKESLKGPQGEPGPQGPKGDPGEVTEEQIAAIVMAISQQIKQDPAMKGPKGDKGDPAEITPELIDQIKQKVLAEMPGVEFVLVDGASGKIIDREAYPPGKPVVLDVRKIVNASKPK